MSRLPVVLHILVHGKEQCAIHTVQPNVLILSGLESGPTPKQCLSWTYWGPTPLLQSNHLSVFPWARLCPSMLSPWLSLHVPRNRNTFPCTILTCIVHVKKFCYFIWFPLCMYTAEKFPLLLLLGIWYQAGSTPGRLSCPLRGLSLLGGSPWSM